MDDQSASPTVTVIVPLFNGEDWLEATLVSIAQQTFQDWELVIVDDGSIDAGPIIARRFAESVPQDVVIIEMSNSGPAAARNTGIRHARGEYVAFLDADDLWHREKLEAQLHQLMSDTSAVAVICDYRVQSESDETVLARRSFIWDDASLQSWALMESFGPCLNSTLLVQRTVLERIGLFQKSMTNIEDLEIAYRLDHAGKVTSTYREHMTYRMHESQNHKDRSTVIRDYRYFLDEWQGVPGRIRARGQANAVLLEAVQCWHERRWFSAIRLGAESVRIAPLQWVRLFLGARRRRRSR